MFGPAIGNVFKIDPTLWDNAEMVTALENEDLVKHFTEEEVKEALFQMEKNKAAGPDSIPLNSTRIVGALSKMILWRFSMIYIRVP